MNRVIKELHLLVGLPGSGKTTYSKEYDKWNSYRRNPKEGNIFDFDNIYRKAGFKPDMKIDWDKINSMKLKSISLPYVIIDGLFTTNEEYEQVLGRFLNHPQYSYISVEKIIIDYWIPNKEACLWNDRGRRKTNSTFTINILDIEKPNIKAIKEKFLIPTVMKTHTVVRKPEYLVMAGENGIYDIYNNKFFYSLPWSLGGYGHGFDGSRYPIDAEEPANFDEFDKLLENICPNITFLQYKKIYKECVRVEEFDVSDYYTTATEAKYVCDLEKLYDMLVDLNIYHVKT